MALAQKRKSAGRSRPKRPSGRLRASPGSERNQVRTLRERIGVGRKVFARLVAMSERSVAAFEAGKDLSETAGRRIAEIARLQDALSRVVDGDPVAAWLQEPNAAFDGLKPLEAIERGQIDRIWRMIYYLESGVPG